VLLLTTAQTVPSADADGGGTPDCIGDEHGESENAANWIFKTKGYSMRAER
jgi:hypothetical protein